MKKVNAKFKPTKERLIDLCKQSAEYLKSAKENDLYTFVEENKEMKKT